MGGKQNGQGFGHPFPSLMSAELAGTEAPRLTSPSAKFSGVLLCLRFMAKVNDWLSQMGVQGTGTEHQPVVAQRFEEGGFIHVDMSRRDDEFVLAVVVRSAYV